ILKSIGNIFGGNQKGSEDFSEGQTAAADKEITDTPAASNPSSTAMPVVSTAASDSAAADPPENIAAAQVKPESTSAVAVVDNESEDSTSLPASNTAINSTTNTTASKVSPSNNDGFWQKNKKWLLPTVIGVGGIAAIAIGMKMLKPANKSVNGLLAGPPKK